MYLIKPTAVNKIGYFFGGLNDIPCMHGTKDKKQPQLVAGVVCSHP